MLQIRVRARAHIQLRKFLHKSLIFRFITHGIFDPREIRIFFHGMQQLQRDRHAASEWDVIQVDGNFDLLENQGKIPDQPFQLGALVIKRRHNQQPIRAILFSVLRKLERLRKIRRSRPNDNIQAIPVLVDYLLAAGLKIIYSVAS